MTLLFVDFVKRSANANAQPIICAATADAELRGHAKRRQDDMFRQEAACS
jgi:hypothetical protein